MRFGELALQPPPLSFLEAAFTKVSAYGDFLIDALGNCPLKDLALALRNFVEYEVLPTPITIDEFRPALHVTLRKPEYER